MNSMNDMERQERIEAYVSGKLAPAEREVFEQAMNVDELLRADVEVERLLHTTLKRGPEMRFRDLVERVSTEQERTPSERGAGGKPVVPIFRGRWRYWAAAASVVLLVGVGAALMMRGPDQEELAMAQVEAFSISVRGDSTTTDPYAVDLMNARRWLLDQHPEEAFALLQKPRSTPCQDAERRWLLGLAYLLTQEETKARAEISAVAQAGCAVSAKAAELLERI